MLQMSNLFKFFISKKYYLLIIAIVLVFFFLRIILLQQPSTDLLYTVKQEDLVDTVQVSGTYMTASQTQVSSPANGIISQLYVTNGDIVKKGEPLFYVDSTSTTDQQTAAYSDYESALSALQSAQNNVQSLDVTMWTQQQSYLNAQNTQNFMNNNVTNPATKNSYTDLEKFAINNEVIQTQKGFEAAEQAYKTAGISVSAAQAKVTQTKQAYAETQSATVTSPASGKVINLEDQIGDAVSGQSTSVTIAGSSTGQASIVSSTPQAVLVIANLSDPYIDVAISEDYATRVFAGQKAIIVFDALKNQTFTGSVSYIATGGTNNQGIVTYAARIITEGLPAVIKPNMTALITIETLRKDNVIDVPNSAIVTKGESIYVLEAKTHKQLPVTLGVQGVTKTEITSGLHSGTVIVANPN
jgi:HlyD family secretion protein